MPSIEGRATSADGTELLTLHWPAIDPWATVLLVHGLGEHSGRYEHVGTQLAAAGIDAYGFDNRGNGGSGGRPGHVDRWSQYLDDLGERLAAVRLLAADRPVALYGHSLGGLIVTGYCLSDRPKPDLVVLSAPGLDSTLPGWKKRLAPVLGRIAPTLAIPNGIDGSTLSRDPSVAARMADDPRCVGVSSARFGAEALTEQVRVRAGVGRGLGVPTLVMHGSDDRLVPPSASAGFEGAPQTTRRIYQGLRHELHNEPEGSSVVKDVLDWLRAGGPGLGRGGRGRAP